VDDIRYSTADLSSSLSLRTVGSDPSLKMQIAFVGTGNPEVNASQVRLQHLARAMAEGGHRVTVIVPDDARNVSIAALNPSAIEPRYFKASSAVGECLIKAQEIVKGHFDIVHVVGIGLRSMQIIGRPFRRPMYIQDYDEMMAAHKGLSITRRIYYGAVESLSRHRAHAIVVASRNLEKLVRQCRPSIGPRLLYLPIGYDSTREGSSGHLDVGLRSIANGRSILTWIGSFWPGYGVEEMLKLADKMQKSGRQYLFMLVGDGPLLEGARTFVASNQLANVVLPGRIDHSDLQAYLRVADVFLLPYPATPINLFRCPTKLFQYIAYNRPVVTNRVGEVAEALTDSGIYYEAENTDSMAKACDVAVGQSSSYDRTSLVEPVKWSNRARCYREWVESIYGAAS
jgi:glycosyltransferase involved in cell wall biosynthesis